MLNARVGLKGTTTYLVVEKNPLRPVSCAECGKDMGQKHYPLTLNPVCMKCVRMLGWDKMTDQEFMEMNKK